MKNQDSISRRSFLKQTGALTGGLTVFGSALSAKAAKGANDKVILGIIGCNGRGMDHINGHLSVPDVEIAYICDVDSRAVEKGIAAEMVRQEAVLQQGGRIEQATLLYDADHDKLAVMRSKERRWLASAP